MTYLINPTGFINSVLFFILFFSYGHKPEISSNILWLRPKARSTASILRELRRGRFRRSAAAVVQEAGRLKTAGGDIMW